MRIHGSCHCGNFAFDLRWEPDPEAIPARACTCSFCRKHAAVWTADPAGVLRVRVRDPARVTKYAFATKTADFHVCTACGAVALATCTIDGRLFAVVNVNTFDDVDPSLLRHASVDFDGEAVESRLARRSQRWIGDVGIAVG